MSLTIALTRRIRGVGARHTAGEASSLAKWNATVESYSGDTVPPHPPGLWVMIAMPPVVLFRPLRV